MNIIQACDSIAGAVLICFSLSASFIAVKPEIVEQDSRAYARVAYPATKRLKGKNHDAEKDVAGTHIHGNGSAMGGDIP
jgi:hypothetical protein